MIVALTTRPSWSAWPQHQVGTPVVDVDLGRLRVAGHVHRLARADEVAADPVEVQQLARERVDQVDRLVAVAGLDVDVLGGRRARHPRGPDGGRRGDLAADVGKGPLEEPQEPGAARVDHSRLAQDGQEARRLVEGARGGVRRGPQDGLDVVRPLGGLDGDGGGLPDHGQHRALDRLRDRPVGRRRGQARGHGRGRAR